MEIIKGGLTVAKGSSFRVPIRVIIRYPFALVVFGFLC